MHRRRRERQKAESRVETFSTQLCLARRPHCIGFFYSSYNTVSMKTGLAAESYADAQVMQVWSVSLQVEYYERESWLSSQLIGSSPNDQDKELLTSLGHHILGSGTTSPVAPPSSLARVMFHHLFKGAPLDVNLGITQKLGFDVALQVLGHVSAHEDKSVTWSLFQYSVCRLWSKLAKMVLCSFAASKAMLDQAMSCILKQDGLLGSGAELIIPAAEPPSYHAARQIKEISPLEAKVQVTYALAKAIGTKQVTSFVEVEDKKFMERFHQAAESEMPNEGMKSESDQALKLCAIQFGAHSLWLEEKSGKYYKRYDTLR